MVKDPVCGMLIDPKTAVASREHAGQTFYFCSQECVDKFDADPHRYGHPAPMRVIQTITRNITITDLQSM